MSRHRIRDSLSSPDLRQAFDYWIAVRGDHGLPARADIRPEDVPDLLPKLFLLEPTADRIDFAFRLAGTDLRAVYGVEPTHRPVHSLFHPAIADRLMAGYRDVLNHHKIEYLELTVYPPSTTVDAAGGPATAQYTYRRLLMPLASDRRTADMLLGCVEAYLLPPAEADVAALLRECAEFTITADVEAL